MAKEQAVVKILDTSFFELQQLEFQASIDPQLSWLVAATLAFHREDIKNLQAQNQANDTLSVDWKIKTIVEARYALALLFAGNAIPSQDMILASLYALSRETCIYAAEASFILSRFEEFSGNIERSIRSLQRSEIVFKKHGCMKHHKAAYNILCLRDELSQAAFSQKRYESFFDIFYSAKENGFAGLSLFNLSVIDVLQKKLDLAEIKGQAALSLLRQDHGMEHAEHAFLNLAHIYQLKGEIKKSEYYLQRCLASPFAEVRTIARALSGAPLSGLSGINLHWSERLSLTNRTESKAFQNENLSRLEERLLELITQGHLGRDEILARLYPKSLNLENTNERFKDVLKRLRKKGVMVIYENGQYILKKS